MEKAKVFISHITEEAPLAEILKRHLLKDFLGLIDTFVSSDSTSIAAGSKWMYDIDRALKTAQAEIILCSKESVKRPWINFEAGAGWIKGIPIVPICHSGLRVADLPVPLSHLQAIQADQATGLARLYNLLAKKLGCAPPNVDFNKIAEDLKSFEDTYETSLEVKKSIGQENVSEMPNFVTQVIEFIERLREREKLTELIEKVSLKGAFSNPFQSRVATWRIVRAREQVASIQERKWELEAMTPTAYVAYIFEGILKLLGEEDEYWTVSNLNFWSNKAVGESAFLDSNVDAARRGATIKRVFLIGEDEWNQKDYRKEAEAILQDHKLASEKVNSIKPGKMHVKYYLTDNLDRDLLVYGHFGLALHPTTTDPEADDGCVVIVPRYESRALGAAISHLKLIFSDGPSSDTETIEYVRKFKKAFSVAKDLNSLL